MGNKVGRIIAQGGSRKTFTGLPGEAGNRICSHYVALAGYSSRFTLTDMHPVHPVIMKWPSQPVGAAHGRDLPGAGTDSRGPGFLLRGCAPLGV